MTYPVVTPLLVPAPDPSILCHPNIPKPLHGVAPRLIAGDSWWRKEREAAILASRWNCMACGTHLSQVLGKKNWLEAHEFYEYDYERGRLTYKKTVALCPYCHSFIHSGRLEVLRQTGAITEETYRAIVQHGQLILQAVGLLQKWRERHSVESRVFWQDWRMVFAGKEYGPSSNSFEEWERGSWKTWKPTGKEKSV